MDLGFSYYSTIIWIIVNHCLESITLVGVVPLTSEWLTSTNSCQLVVKTSLKPMSSWTHVKEHNTEDSNCRVTVDTLSWIVMFITMPVVGLITSPFAGWLCDRYGAIRMQIVGAVIMVLTNCLYAFSDRFEMVILARAINGLGTSLILSSECAFVINHSPSDKIKNKTVFSLYCTSGMEYIGVTFIGVLFEASGQAIPFLLIAFCFSISAMMLMYFGQRRHGGKKRSMNNNSNEENQFINREDTILNNNNINNNNNNSILEEHAHGGFIVLFHDRKILIAAYLTFASTITRAALLSVYGVWTSAEFGATVKEYSLAWLPTGCFYIFIHILGTFVIVKYFQYAWLCAMLSLGIGSSLTLVVPWTNSLLASMFPLALSISFGSLCRTMIISIITSYSKHNFPYLSGHLASLIIFTGFFIPYILGPLLAILLLNSYGLVAVTVITSCISFLALPLPPMLRSNSVELERIPLLAH